MDADNRGTSSAREAHALQLHLLGPVQVRGPGGAELSLQPKRLALLVYLAVAKPRGAHRRDTLLALFWPEQDADSARGALRQALRGMRQALPSGVLVTEGDDVGLDRRCIVCDVWAFEDAIGEAEPERAVQLYRAPFLSGFFVGDSPQFEQWAEGERDRLARSYRTVLEQSAARAVEQGDRLAAVTWWRRVSEQDPYSTRVALRVMQALEVAGDRAGALRHAEQHSARLQEDFGAEPAPDVVAFAERLRAYPPEHPSLRAKAPQSSVVVAMLERFRDAMTSRYEIQREIGSGGMATVYLAQDIKHDRQVALKVLKPELGTAVGPDRFLREIRVTARLNHPHILPLLDSGEADGVLYYVLPYVEGESLRERLNRVRELQIDEAVQIAREVADALAHAHDRGVVHRDIKPENILLSGGHALVTDFGIARAKGALDADALTLTGQSVGTPTYMSPEQATAGRDVDARTDLYSLGVVLYEMLTGEPPFTGKTAQAIIARVMTDRPTFIRTLRDTVPESLERIVMRSLAKVPADRWKSATEFAAALHLNQTAKAAGIGEPRSRRWYRTRKRALLAGTLAALLVVSLAAWFLFSRQGRRVIVEESADAVAVLPFSVRGAALTEWREGVVDLLSTALDGAGGLRAINSRTVLARWNELVLDTAAGDERIALEVARQTGARYALLGSAVALGGDVRLVAQVYDLQEGRRLGQVQADGSPDSVLALMDRLAVRTLGLTLPGRADLAPVDLASVTTTSVPALKAYLEGESLLRAGEFKGAIAAYERALEGDPQFALAYSGLFRAATFEYGINSPLRYEARQRAFELIDRLPERKALMIRLSMHWLDPGRDFPEKALRPLEAAVVRYPDDAELWHELAEARLYVLESVGSWDAVEQPLRRAVEIAPKFAPYWIHLIELTLVHDGDSAVVAQLMANYESVSADSRRAKLLRIAVDLIYGDSVHRARAVDRLHELGTDGLNDDELLFYLSSPRQWPSYKQALEALYRHGSHGDKVLATLRLARRVVLARGRLRDGLRYLQDPILPASEARKLLYWLAMHRIPIPAQRIAALGEFDVERAPQEDVFLHGVYAADQGQWAAHGAAVARLDRIADSLTAAGASARGARARSWALEARARWRRGRPEVALVALRDTLHELPLDIYLWAGRLCRETGCYEQAARHYAHFMLWRVDPLVSYELGQVYQALGDRQRAREAYQLFTDTWAQADPELQPLVEDARRRLRPLQ